MQPPQGPNQQQPLYPGYAPPAQEPQWTQRPLPGQMAGGGFVPGQVPPPAQIAPEGNPGYAYVPGGVSPSGQGMAGQTPPAQGVFPQQGVDEQDPQTAHVVRPGPKKPGYQLPSTGMPRLVRPRSKLPWFLLAAAVVGVVVFVLMRSMAPGQAAYGYARFGSLSSRYAGDAVVVRSETVYAQEGVSQIGYDVAEGSSVDRGTVVATIYTSGFSAREWITLQNYRNQIKEHHKSLISNASSDSRLLSLTTQVRERALEAQRLVQGSRGSLSGQEVLLGEAMQALRTYIRQKFPDDQKLSRLYDEERNQLQRIATWSKQFAAPHNGLVSFYTDGFESALNMTNYADYTPAQVRSMYSGHVPQMQEKTPSRNSTDVYRLVRSEPWVVLMLCSDQDWTPITGRSYELLIENFDNIVVRATVESFTRSGGELLLRLRVDDTEKLPNVLYIRSCRVQVGESVNTLQVPSRAIYVQNGRKGVVMATEGGEYWTGVEVVSDDGSVAYIVPESPGVLFDGVPVRLF